MFLGEIIKAYRIEKGISLQAFGDKCGLSKGYIAMLEKNFNPKTKEPIVPSSATFCKVADAMGISLEELLSKVDENQPIEINSIVSANKSMSDQSNISPIDLSDRVTIPVFGRVPAGVPIEAIQDINEYIDIPKSWTTGGKEYFALTVKGDSMYPKYLDGDVVVVRVEEDCESGQDCVVYVNGYDATLKKVVKKDDYLILQPLNLEYEPRMFDLRDDATPPVKIAGVVVEIRRRV